MDLLTNIGEELPGYLSPLMLTVAATVFGSILALIIAFTLGLMAGSHNLAVRGPARTIIEFFRGTSLVVQLYWLAVVVPLLFQIRFDEILIIIVIALGLNYGAYAAEVVRGAIAAVPKAQWEACVALNLTYWQKMRRVIVPQAWPEMIPPLSTLAILLLKGSALGSLAAEFQDLTFHANQIGSRPDQNILFHFGMILVFYFILAYLISAGMRYLERRAKLGVGQAPPPKRVRRPAVAAAGTGGVV